jgi:hypothetical protein
MATLSVLTWIGNAAAVLGGQHGAITTQTQQAGCSRQAAYQHAQRVQQAVADCQAGEPSRPHLLAEAAQLREENRQLWDALEDAVDFPKAKQRHFTAVAAALGLSLQQTVVLLAILLPGARCPSRATVGRWVQHVTAQATRLLPLLDTACRGLVQTLCLDEIFCHRQPLLIGVEPHSMTWVLGQRAADRTGTTWCAALVLFCRLNYAIVDGGSGLAKGLKLVQHHWQHEAPLFPKLPLQTNLDNFHIQQQGQRALRCEWQAAEQLWLAAEAADRQIARADRQGHKKTGAVKRAQLAWAKAEAAFTTAQEREAAWQRATAALEIFRPDGPVNTRDWAAAEIAAAVATLPGERWAKTRRMLQNQQALTFLDRLAEQLQQAEPRAEVRDAVVAYWRLQQDKPRRQEAAAQGLVSVLRRLVQARRCRELASDWEVSLARVGAVLAGTVRASSVVECMNSVVRMHQARHRTLTQGLLDWKRLYWNCRDFAAGKRRGHCPYEHLGLRLPTYDAWALVQMDPEELAQQVSTTKLAA